MELEKWTIFIGCQNSPDMRNMLEIIFKDPGGTVKNQPDSPPAELPTRPSCTWCMPTCRHDEISSLVAVATGESSRTRTSDGKNVVSCGFPYRLSARISEKGIPSPNHDVLIISS
ncbi:uncharacterized protein LOC128212968 [Mya arenaria]|uniref:uncharacterized protein LOC128212968 n=1 Tax=Mya arenaria TaxID=6604 RepID=UPI0022DF458A|nr:uncharacterized protein LOC128212968 [Mya arenaria]